MHKRTVSNQLHSTPYHPQKHTFSELNSSAFISNHYEHTNNSGCKAYDFASIRDSNQKYSIKNRCKTEYQDSWSVVQPKSSYNMQKLRHLQEMKSSNIDNLNKKIKSLITKLTAESSTTSSGLFEVQTNVRLKNDYTTNYRQREQVEMYQNSSQQIKYNNFEGKGMFQSTILSQNSQFNNGDADRNKHRKKHQQLAMIRLKYKSNTSVAALKTSLNPVEINPRKKDNIQFFGKQKPKLKIKKEVQSTRKQGYSISQKQNLPTTSPLNKKKNINQQFYNYQKKLESYNMKRKALLNQCQNINILKELSENCSFHKPKEYSQLQTKDSPQQSKVLDEGEGELPTADFRKIEDADSFQTLLSNLMSQIKFDEQFRKAKKWLSRYPQKLKWTEIDFQIKQRSIELDELSIKQIFTLRDEEESPFYSFREADFTVKKVVEAFVQSQEHWFQNLVKKFNKRSLQQNGLNQKLLDISGRGYISVEDFVRMLNIEMNAQVRNRDLLLIFERLKGEDRLSFEDLLQVICH